SMDEMIDFLWRLVLNSAAETKNPDGSWAVDDTLLNRMIKDAVDNGTQVLGSLKGDPEDGSPSSTTTTTAGGPDAATTSATDETTTTPAQRTDRLAVVYQAGEWKALPTTKKKHNMRRAIDRRFDGEKHL